MLLFDERKPFFKGNLHCHTTRSDGKLPPEDVRAFYRSQGYDFLALTDHRKQSEQPYFENGMLLLPGVEEDFLLPHEAVHIVGFGMDEGYSPLCAGETEPQTCIEHIRNHGGRAILCHPAWSLNTPDTISSFEGLTAVEIYNSTSTYPWNGDRADSSILLDIAAAQGKLNNFVASDDSHSYTGEAGVSATMVQAESLTQEAILSAMDEGRFYCTQGPRIEQISVMDGKITVNCSPASYVIFYSNLVWADDRCVSGEDITEASYTIKKDMGEAFVRIQIMDACGKSAWSNPIKL